MTDLLPGPRHAKHADEPAPTVAAGASPRLRTFAMVVAMLSGELAIVLAPTLTRDWSGPLAGAAMVSLAVLGLVVVFGLPFRVLSRAALWNTDNSLERRLYALGSVLAGVIAVGLLINTVLPLAGVGRPLTTPVIVAVSTLINVALLLRPPTPAPIQHDRRPLDAPTLWAMGAVALAVTGAVRLNNGSGPVVAVSALIVSAGVLVGMLRRGADNPTSDARQVYLLGLAVLLGTSLRGWGIVGHDIQREWLVYTLTHDAGRWQQSLLENAYNACLSLNILPTIVAAATGITGPALFKVFAQLLFAVVPVVLYVVSRRLVPRRWALIAVALFVSFPTFVNDMPMLVRQEVAFCFVAFAVLAATQPGWGVLRRRLVVVAAGLGVVLSHYSTTYVLVLMLAIAAIVDLVPRIAQRLRNRAGPASERPVLTSLSVLAALVAACALWTGPITNSSGFARTVVTDTWAQVFGGAEATGSSDLAYRIFAPETLSAQERLAEYDEAVRETLDQRLEDGADLLPLDSDSVDLAVVASEDIENRPAGEPLEAVGVDPSTITDWSRRLSALALQVMLLVGVAAVTVRMKGTERWSPELRAVAVGATVGMAVIAVIPGLSVSYGLLRLFQQTLLLLAPVIAIGLWTLFRPLGSRRDAVATVIVVAMFVSLTGIATQVLGGPRPQLNTSTTGDYFDRYYTSPAETAAMTWVRARGDQISEDVPLVSDYYALHRLTAYEADPLALSDRIHPLELSRSSWVLLGTPTVIKHQATVPYAGDQVTFTYPLDPVDSTKSRVFDDGFARVYR